MMMMNQKKSTDLVAYYSNKMLKTNSTGLIILLPSEITMDIFFRLPLDSVIHCKRVCKTWRSLVDDPTFLALLTHRFMTETDQFFFLLFVAHKDRRLLSTTHYRLHFGVYYDDDEDNDNANNTKKKKIMISSHVKQCSNNSYKPIPHYPFEHHQCSNLKRITSCNGLLLIASISPSHDTNLIDDMIVFNPLTREYVCLPPLDAGLVPLDDNRSMTTSSMITGFGYHPSTNEYKVVTIVTYPRRREEEQGSVRYVYVYTLGSGRWRRTRSIDYSCYSVFHYMGVLLNGALHWIGVTADDGVLSFDLANEELKMIPSPPMEAYRLELSSSYGMDQQLGVLGGCLCVSRILSAGYISRTEIWVLMKYPAAANSCNMSWTMKFSIVSRIREKSYAFVGALESGKILFSTFHDRGLRLIAYDPETHSIHEHHHDQSESFSTHMNGHSSLIKLIPHVKSFVSLKALGEETAKYI